MGRMSGDWAAASAARRYAADESRRADLAALLATDHERAAATGGAFTAVHLRLAELQRRTEQRHRAGAQIHYSYVNWIRTRSVDASARPFMAAIAASLHAAGATVSLLGRVRSGDTGEAMAASSDEVAAAAHELELVLGEGPGHEVLHRSGLVCAVGAGMDRPWPVYGPAVRELGIRSVAAAPLGGSTCLGVVTVFDVAERVTTSGVLLAAAEALTDLVLSAPEVTDDEDGIPALPLCGDGDYHALLHQAAGMIAERWGCAIPDAVSLIRARAYAEDQRLENLAARIVQGREHLDPAGPGSSPDR